MTTVTDLGKCWCGGNAVLWDISGPMSCADSSYHDPTDFGPTEPVRSLYVSGPMSGYPDCNYPLFDRSAASLRSLGYRVANPAETTGRSYRALLAGDIGDLLTCDGVALLEGWWLSTGARLEVQIAGVLQKPCRPLADWGVVKP